MCNMIIPKYGCGHYSNRSILYGPHKEYYDTDQWLLRCRAANTPAIADRKLDEENYNVCKEEYQVRKVWKVGFESKCPDCRGAHKEAQKYDEAFERYVKRERGEENVWKRSMRRLDNWVGKCEKQVESESALSALRHRYQDDTVCGKRKGKAHDTVRGKGKEKTTHPCAQDGSTAPLTKIITPMEHSCFLKPNSTKLSSQRLCRRTYPPSTRYPPRRPIHRRRIPQVSSSNNCKTLKSSKKIQSTTFFTPSESTSPYYPSLTPNGGPTFYPTKRSLEDDQRRRNRAYENAWASTTGEGPMGECPLDVLAARRANAVVVADLNVPSPGGASKDEPGTRKGADRRTDKGKGKCKKLAQKAAAVPARLMFCLDSLACDEQYAQSVADRNGNCMARPGGFRTVASSPSSSNTTVASPASAYTAAAPFSNRLELPGVRLTELEDLLPASLRIAPEDRAEVSVRGQYIDLVRREREKNMGLASV